MPTYEINIKTTDDPSGVEDATEKTVKLTDAMGKLLEQAERRQEYAEAKKALAQMSEEEKAAALAARQLAQAQEEAARQMRETQEEAQRNASFTNQMKMAWTEMNSALEIGQKVIQTGQYVWDLTGGKVVALADQVRELKNITGGTAEEMSLLIAVGDDVGISFETIQRAMQTATRKGLDPNLEGIIALAEQYQRIQDPFEQSRFLMDAFGESGSRVAELMRMTAEEIRTAGEEAARTGQLLSEAEIQAAREFQIQMDNMQDEWNRILLSLGKESLPLIANWAAAWQKSTDEIKDQGYWFQKILPIQLVRTAYLTAEAQAARDAAAAEGLLNDELAEQKTRLDGLPKRGNLADFNARPGDVNYDNPGYYADLRSGNLPGKASGGAAESIQIINETGFGHEILVMGGNNGYILNQQQAQQALQGGGGEMIIIPFYYQPGISLATKSEAERVIKPLIEDAVRNLRPNTR